MTENPATPARPEADAVADIVKRLHNPQVIALGTVAGKSVDALVTPMGMMVTDLKAMRDAHRDHPERYQGTAELTTLQSLIDHARRFRTKDSALFGWPDAKEPTLTTVLDYHQSREDDNGTTAYAQFREHRGIHRFPLSDEWTAWTEVDGAPMDQVKFAEWIENRVGDLMAPPPNLVKPKKADAGGDFGRLTPDEELANFLLLLGGDIASPSRMVELSRGLSLRAEQRVHQAFKLESGETQIQFTDEHTDEAGQPLKVPNLFLIAIPVFKDGEFYRIAARLRYRVRGGSIVWFFELYRHDRVFDHAFREACEKASQETGLPLFYGKPE